MSIVNRWSILCSRCVIDSQTNNVSLIDIIDEVGAELADESGLKGALVLPINAQLVTLWVRERRDVGAKGRVRIAVEDPAGVVVLPGSEFEIDLSAFVRLRMVTDFNGLPVRGSGEHHVKVQLYDAEAREWRQAGDVPVDVKLGVKPAVH